MSVTFKRKKSSITVKKPFKSEVVEIRSELEDRKIFTYQVNTKEIPEFSSLGNGKFFQLEGKNERGDRIEFVFVTK